MFFAPPAVVSPAPADLSATEGWVDANGVLIWYLSVGKGAPLVVLHGGPGMSHDYLLPYLLPLARHNRVVFIDERGGGKSTKLEDPAGYTVENMVEDVEAVRQALHLGKISLLGHSYGGVLAQAYALKYGANLSHLVLCSTFASTKAMNEVLAREKAAMPADARAKVEKLEKDGLFGHGKPYEQGRYPVDYEIAAWGDGYYPYLYRNHPDPSFDPVVGAPDWPLYRQMWGSHGEFVIDGNLSSVEYVERLPGLKVPTLVTAGDHDECDPAMAKEMAAKIPGAKLVVFPDSGHMTFVDQTDLFLKTVSDFIGSK